MANLGPKSTSPNTQRPFQSGRAEGQKSGANVSTNVEWLFDTGAMVCAVTKNVADQFDLTPTGATAKGTTGGGGIIMKKGLTITFDLEDAAGRRSTVSSNMPVGVKPNNSGNEVVGMDQMTNVNAKIEWDPGAQSGRIYK